MTTVTPVVAGTSVQTLFEHEVTVTTVVEEASTTLVEVPAAAVPVVDGAAVEP